MRANGIASWEKVMSAEEMLQLANAISVAGSESNAGQDQDDTSVGIDQKEEDELQALR